MWEKLQGMEKEEARKESQRKENKKERAVDTGGRWWRTSDGLWERRKERAALFLLRCVFFPPHNYYEIGICLAVDGIWILYLARWQFWCSCHCLCINLAFAVYTAVISSIYTLWEDQASTIIKTWRMGVSCLNDNPGVILKHSLDLYS